MANLVAACRPCNARRGGVYRVAKVSRVTRGASRDWLAGVGPGVFGGAGARLVLEPPLSPWKVGEHGLGGNGRS
jgi:hypothetical protein